MSPNIYENSTDDVDLSTAEVQQKKLMNELSSTGMKTSKVEENYEDMRKILDEVLEQASYHYVSNLDKEESEENVV